jgi:uncharacterized membrane protein YfcA
MTLLAYLASLLIGLVLGLLGGGGSILTLPVLVYLFGLSAVEATAYSLFIVGVTALASIIPKARASEIDFKTALSFGLPSIVAVYFTRSVLMPAIPDPIWSNGTFALGKGTALMLLFAVLMVWASISMIKGPQKKSQNSVKEGLSPVAKIAVVLAEGLGVGLLTGLVGAGGGFLIIPALVLLAKLPMKQAVGTSLIIIASKSLLGFLGDLGRGAQIDWTFMLIFSAIAVVGIFSGAALSKKISGEKLKPAFGWFVLIMGIYIIVNSLLSMK